MIIFGVVKMEFYEAIIILLIIGWLIAEWYVLNRACDKQEGKR
jgi:hypothetical protein